MPVLMGSKLTRHIRFFACCDLQDGWTALMVAAQSGHDAVAKALLEQGATVDHADTVGFVKC